MIPPDIDWLSLLLATLVGFVIGVSFTMWVYGIETHDPNE